MGKYANHRCYNCQIIRPAPFMKREKISYKSGRSGISASISPYAKSPGKSLRLHSGRSYKRFREVWVCVTKDACDNPEYFTNNKITAKEIRQLKDREDNAGFYFIWFLIKWTILLPYTLIYIILKYIIKYRSNIHGYVKFKFFNKKN